MNAKIIARGLVGSAAAATLLVGGAASAATQIGGPWNGGSHTPPGVFGSVTAISGDTITVSSKGFGQNASATTYTVDAAGATVTKGGSASSVSSIAVGDNVMVQGTVSGDTVTAAKINDGMMMGGRGGPGMMHNGVFGTVASISGTTLTVTSKGFGPNSSSNAGAKTYTVNATNATVTKNGAASSVSAIAVGDTVMVQGAVSGDSVTATSINDGVVPGAGGKGAGPSIQGNGEPVVGGTITAINGSSLTITNASNVTYTIDASSATVDKGNATSSVSNLAVGDQVIVQGSVNGNAVTASSVIDQGASASSGSGTPAHGFGGILGSIGGFFHKLFGFF